MAEVSGVDLTRPLAPAEVAAIEEAIAEHAVLVFRAQRISDDGQLKAESNGQTVIKVVDADGKEAVSHDIFVGRASPPPGGGGECPLGNPQLCQMICKFMPNLPWCKGFDGNMTLSRL